MKVARRLKYYSPETDLDALQRELRSSGDSDVETDDYSDDDDSDDDDQWDDEDSWDATTSHSYSAAWDDYKD